jgi:hypothetical protein
MVDPAKMTPRAYAIHSRVLAVSAWPDLLAAIHARLHRFETTGPADHADLRISFVRGARGAQRESGARCVYEFPSGRAAYSDHADLLTIVIPPRVHVSCRPVAGEAVVTVENAAPDDTWLLSHPVLTLLLAEMLKRRRLFALHAGAVALSGKGLLLAGTSGVGKSTLSVAMVRAGCALLGDDTVFLEMEAGGLQLRAFPDEVDLCDDTFRFFPELTRSRSDARPASARAKRSLDPTAVYDGSIQWDASPHVLVFPQRGDGSEPVLAEIPRDEALLQLVPNVLLTDRLASQQHLDALTATVAQCRCFALRAGSDIPRTAALLHELMTQ